MSSKNLGISQVEAWLSGLRSEMNSLEDKLAPLLDERNRLEEQERILVSLLESLKGIARPQAAASDSKAESTPTTGSVKEYVESRVVEILEESDRDRLHINEIYARFRDKGYEIPGAGKPVNITSHIRISERIRSPKRGFYGLVEEVGDIPPRTQQKRKQRK